MEQGSQSLALDATILREPVRRALGRNAAHIVSWEYRSLHWASNQVTGGLFRVDGQALDRGEALPWSIVLKIARNAVHLGQSTDDPSGVNYWKREPLLYHSGLLGQLPSALLAFYAALDRLPITFCHLDAFRRNLLIRRDLEGSDGTVAVDWAFSGLGPVGADVAPLIGGGLALGQLAPDQFGNLTRQLSQRTSKGCAVLVGTVIRGLLAWDSPLRRPCGTEPIRGGQGRWMTKVAPSNMWVIDRFRSFSSEGR